MATEFIARKTATYRVVCTSPDVCKVPKNTPVPFPIQEMLSSSTKTSTKTFANGCEIFTYESYTTKVTGDQPGVRKGIKSGTVGEAARPIEYSFSVYVEGVRIVRVNDACEMNEGNTVGKVVYAPPPKADKITDEGKIDSTKDEFIRGMCIQRGLDAEACEKVKHLDYWIERGEEFYTSMKNKAESITSDQVVSAINDAAETVSTTIKDTISFYQHASREQIVSGAEALGERVIEVGEEMLSDTWDWLKGTYDNLANSKSVAEGAGVLSAAVVGAVNPGKKIEKLSEGLEKLGKLDGPGKEKKDKKSEPEEGGSVRGRPRKKVKCFCATKSEGYKKCKTDAERQRYLKDYQRQLKDQQDAINNMTAEEFLSAREAREANMLSGGKGRNPLAESEQRRIGNEFKGDISESIANSIMKKNSTLSYRDAKTIADGKAASIRSELAALHNPDNIAGGFNTPTPTKMGSASINSSIGSSWDEERLNQLDMHAKVGKKDEKMNIELNVCKKRDCSE